MPWGPDGRGIYFLSDRDDDYHIYYLAVSDGGGEPRRRSDAGAS